MSSEAKHRELVSEDKRAVKPPGFGEFSLRAVICGLVVAAVMGASYPYVVLKLGFGPNVSVVAAFFGYLALGIAFKDYNRWENNIVQTAGTAAAQTAFMCVLLAAFDMLAASRTVSFTSLASARCSRFSGSRPPVCSACCSPCRCASILSWTRS